MSLIIHKQVSLKDGNGNKLARKIHRDSKGLYVINKGMKGYLVKSVKSHVVGDKYLSIRVTRKVDYYVST